MLVYREVSFPLAISLSINKRVKKIEVNREESIPMKSITAKPITGPLPRAHSITAAIPVVIFASIIEE